MDRDLEHLLFCLADYITRPSKERKRGVLAGDHIELSHLLKDYLLRCREPIVGVTPLMLSRLEKLEAIVVDARAIAEIAGKEAAKIAGSALASLEQRTLQLSDQVRALSDEKDRLHRELGQIVVGLANIVAALVPPDDWSIDRVRNLLRDKLRGIPMVADELEVRKA